MMQFADLALANCHNGTPERYWTELAVVNFAMRIAKLLVFSGLDEIVGNVIPMR